MNDLRKRLRNISYKNQSLQDVLKSSTDAMSLVSIEKYDGKVHNTKMVLKLDRGSSYKEQERYYERVCFYNRVNLATILPGDISINLNPLQNAIDQLNVEYGCDFTEDDIYILNGQVAAKEDSIGYIDEVSIQPWTVQYTVISTGEIVRIDTGNIVSAQLIDPDIIGSDGNPIANPAPLNDRDNLIINNRADLVKTSTLFPGAWNNLTKITLDAKETEPAAFAGPANNLQTVHLGTNVRTIASDTFAGKTNIASFTMDEGVESFGGSILTSTKITSLIFPDSVKEISVADFDNGIQGGFLANDFLEKLVLGGGLKTVDAEMFAGSISNLKHIEFRKGVETILGYWSASASVCETLIFNQELKNIGLPTDQRTAMFGSFSKIKKLLIPKTVEYVGKMCFQDYSAVEEFIIEEGCEAHFDEFSFQNWGWLGPHPLKTFLFGGGSIFGRFSFQNWNIAKEDFEIIVPKTATLFDQESFQNHQNTKKLSFAKGSKPIIRQNAFINWFKATHCIIGDEVQSVAASFMNWYQCEYLYIGKRIKILGRMGEMFGQPNPESEFVNFGNNLSGVMNSVIVPDSVETIYGLLDGGAKAETIILSKNLKAAANIGSSSTKNIYFRNPKAPAHIYYKHFLSVSMPSTIVYVPDLIEYSKLDDLTNPTSSDQSSLLSVANIAKFIPPVNINDEHKPSPIELPSSVGWDIAYLNKKTGIINTVKLIDETKVPDGFMPFNSNGNRNSEIDDVVINSHVKTLGKGCLAGHYGIHRLKVLGDNLENIGAGALAGVVTMKELILGKGLKRVGPGAMADMSFLPDNTYVPVVNYISVDISAFSGWNSNIPVPNVNVKPSAPTITSITASIVSGTGVIGENIDLRISRITNTIFGAVVKDNGSWQIDLSILAEPITLVNGDVVSAATSDVVGNTSSIVSQTVSL